MTCSRNSELGYGGKDNCLNQNLQNFRINRMESFGKFSNSVNSDSDHKINFADDVADIVKSL